LHWGVFFWPEEKRPVGDRRWACNYNDLKGSLACPDLDILDGRMDEYNERALLLNRTHMSRFFGPLLFFVGEVLGLATEERRIASNTKPEMETHLLRHSYVQS
jgi:hypothetical protein